MVNSVDTMAENNNSTMLLLQKDNNPNGPFLSISLITSMIRFFTMNN